MTKIIDNGTEVYLEFRHYQNGQKAIQAFEAETGECWNMYTVCLPDLPLKSNYTILDTNNSPGVLKLLEDAGIVKDTGHKGYSGFCSYPVVELLKPELWEEE